MPTASNKSNLMPVLKQKLKGLSLSLSLSLAPEGGQSQQLKLYLKITFSCFKKF
jgi:hypothetical protein